MRKKADYRMVLVRFLDEPSEQVRAAQTNLLSNLRSVDGIDGDIVLSEILLHLVRHALGFAAWLVQELLQFVGIEDGVQQELTVLLQTARHVVHVEISLNVASHEVRRGYQICRADRRITETQVRAGEAARLLRVVREVSLAILIGVVTNNLRG